MTIKRNSLTNGASATVNVLDNVITPIQSSGSIDNPITAPILTFKEKFKKGVDAAKKSEAIAGLSEVEVTEAFKLFDVMVKQQGLSAAPVIEENCVIEMDLMLGGHLKIVPPTGYHVMQGKRQMDIDGEKGNRENMLSTYVMAACSTIDDKPMAMHDLAERFTARDLRVALDFFCRINLL